MFSLPFGIRQLKLLTQVFYHLLIRLLVYSSQFFLGLSPFLLLKLLHNAFIPILHHSRQFVSLVPLPVVELVVQGPF